MKRIKPRQALIVLAVLLLSITAVSSASAGKPGGSTTGGEYVALGDSYSSGNGTGSSNLSFFCGRSTLAYPYLVAQQRSLTLKFAACMAATTSNVLSSQISSLTSNTAYVTITIGGNDVQFGTMVQECPEAGESTACWNAINGGTSDIETTLGGKLDQVYSAIKSRSPKAKVVVLGYGLKVSRLCAGTSGITQAEADALNIVADKLDAKTAERVALAGANFTYKSAIQPFATHDICSSTPWIRGDTNNLFHDFHPNSAGHKDGYTPMVRSVIG